MYGTDGIVNLCQNINKILGGHRLRLLLVVVAGLLAVAHTHAAYTLQTAQKHTHA